MVKYQQESIYKGSLLMHKFLLVPGSDERKIHKSISVGADCVVYDLEDSVSSNKKGTARHMVIDALEVKKKKKKKGDRMQRYSNRILGIRTWKSRKGCKNQCSRLRT